MQERGGEEPRREDRRPLTLREYLGAFLPPRQSEEARGSQEGSETSERPLTLREYLGVFLPPRVQTREEVGDRPLTIREYISAVPNIDDFVSAARWVGQRVMRLVGKR